MPWTAGIIRGKLITTMINHIPSWLVVWLPCLAFSHINWELHHPNWLSYFSKGFKPPTRPYSLYILTKFYLSTILEAKKNGQKKPKIHNEYLLCHREGNQLGFLFFLLSKSQRAIWIINSNCQATSQETDLLILVGPSKITAASLNFFCLSKK